ncbi:MAG: polysaccharide biosynthesis/export family protein [Patescibacteria group bacterium]
MNKWHIIPGIIVIIALCLTLPLQAEDDGAYRLDAGDTILITVWGHEDLRTQATVGPDGRISLPLLGEVDVRGTTLAELRQMLTARWAEYIRDPQVTVALAARRQISVKVFGQVNRPGSFQVYPDASIAELIAMAGGPTKRAALEAVQVLPGGDPDRAVKVPQGRNDKFGVGEAVRGLQLSDGDVIFVPETRKVDLTLIITILGGLLTLKELLS